MKKILKKLIDFFIIKNNTVWQLTQATLIRAANYLTNQKALIESIHTNKYITTLALNHIGLKVRNGPFKGMMYPEISTVESTLLPKLLGSYEKEIQSCIESICQVNYSEIINIGCGEGYYAVGLALKNPNAKVFAFDINKQARVLCRKMAILNGVEDRISISNHRSSEFQRYD